MKLGYTYIVLRYMHDTTTGEFLNVGVALYCPDKAFLACHCRDTYGRITKTFPNADGESFKRIMSHVATEFEKASARLSAEVLPLHTKPSSVAAVAHAILPPDASSLQWSEERSGLTADPAATLEKLYERFVTRHDQKHARESRQDEDVWKSFKRTLEARHVLRYFEAKTIAGQNDEVELKHAYLNAQWHCIEPLSFDQSTAEGIKDKARKWVGQMVSVQDSPDQFKLYLLVGAPTDEALRPVYEKSLALLAKIPGEKEIIREEQAEEFSNRLAGFVDEHEIKNSEDLNNV